MGPSCWGQPLLGATSARGWLRWVGWRSALLVVPETPSGSGDGDMKMEETNAWMWCRVGGYRAGGGHMTFWGMVGGHLVGAGVGPCNRGDGDMG